MPRRRKQGVRVLGPYQHGTGWRFLVKEGSIVTPSQTFPTKRECQALMQNERKHYQGSERTVEKAIEDYEMYLRDEKGNKPKSYQSTIWRMKRFFSEPYLPISDLTVRKCAGYYEALTRQPSRYEKPYATDSHRNILAEAKTFLKWCSKEKGWLSKNPLEEVQGQGKRRHGKAQLRIDEARAWLVKALEMADKAKPGAVAALVALLMGMRGGEIVSRVVRDLDDQGRLLWIPDSKTSSGKRRLEVPELIRPYLLALAKDRPANELLFGMYRGRPHLCAWVRLWVKQICKAAEVPMVTAHGMRGLHSTLALSAGTSGHVVAASLGHASVTTTLESYADSSAVAHATQQKVLNVLKGGQENKNN